MTDIDNRCIAIITLITMKNDYYAQVNDDDAVMMLGNRRGSKETYPNN